MIRSAPSCWAARIAKQTDRAVTDDRDGLSGAGLGGVGGEPAGAQHVGGGQQRRDEVVVRLPGRGDQGAVGVRDARLLGLGADAGVHELGVHALGLEPGLADLAGVVGDDERSDDEVARLERLHRVADLLHDADVLVAHQRVVDGLDAAVGPQVGPADAGRGQADDGVGRLDDPRVLSLLDSDVTGSVHHNSTHRGRSSVKSSLG